VPPFDSVTDAKNQKDHGLSLAFGERVIADPRAIELIDDRFPYGEERWNVLGMVDGKIYVTTYTDREDGCALHFSSRCQKAGNEPLFRKKRRCRKRMKMN
jgi:uncharacterized DUF497 family protein